MSKGIHRVTADSMAGRRMTQAKGASTDVKPLSAHNQAVEAKRAAKQAAKKARREAESKFVEGHDDVFNTSR